MLAIFAAVLCFIGVTAWSIAPYEMAMRQVGENASAEHVQKAFQEIIISGKAPVSPTAVTLLIVGIICGIAALALALKSLISNERHYVKAILACLIAAMFVVCQGIFMLAIFQHAPTST